MVAPDKAELDDLVGHRKAREHGLTGVFDEPRDGSDELVSDWLGRGLPLALHGAEIALVR